MNFNAKARTLRLHFNRHGAAPLVWCVATEDFEIAVHGFTLQLGAGVATVYISKATPDDEDGKPSAWLENTMDCEVRIVDGWAYIERIQP